MKRNVIIALFLMPGYAGFADTDYAVVLSTAMSTSRDSVSVQAQLVDLETNSILPGIQTLPGQQIYRSLERIETGGALYVSTGYSRKMLAQGTNSGQSYLTELSQSSFYPAKSAHFPNEPGWEHEFIGKVPDTKGNTLFVTLGNASTKSGSKISFYDWSGNLPVEVRRWGMPGEVMDAIVLEDGVQVAVAYRSARQRGGGIMLGTIGTAPAQRSSLSAPEGGAYPLQPLKLAQYNDALLVLGIAPRKENPAEFSMWVQLLDVENLKPIGSALSLAGGQMGSKTPIASDNAGGFWISTRSPDTRFAYVNRVQIKENGLAKIAAYSLPKTSTPVYMAQSASSEALAVAYNQTLEVWQDGRREKLHKTDLSGPIGALAWSRTGESLLVGEVGRLHAFHAPFASPTTTLQLQSGWIQAIFPTQMDDPHVKENVPTPAFNLPHSISFRGEAVGREVHAMRIASESNEKTLWEVEVTDPDSASWLRIAPLKGIGSGAVYMGIDPAQYNRNKWAETSVRVNLDTGTRQKSTDVFIQVVPQKVDTRQIFWLWDREANHGFRDKSDPYGFRAIANHLAAAPHYFSHYESSSSVSLNLQQFSLVVVPIRALAQGKLIRTELFDYVLQGGSALILGDAPDTPIPSTLHEWFRPAGVEMGLSKPLAGNITLLPHPYLQTAGLELTVKHGTRFITSEGALAPLADDIEQTAFVALEYGYGRMIFLADSTLLLSDALKEEKHLRLSMSIFNWLASAGVSHSDMDSDLLVDNLEDKNNNGIVDPGETDFLTADTDGDFLPDGAEDANRNGKLDPGETDPRNVDTDGDGIWDGADFSPYPDTGIQLPTLQNMLVATP